MKIQKVKQTTLPEIKSNLGIERRYYKAVMTMINELQAEINASLIKEYKRSARQEKLAMDGVSDWVAHVIEYLSDQWEIKLNRLAPSIAQKLIESTATSYDTALKRHLRDAGFTVQFQMTAFTEDMLKASVAENVRLIKSIASGHLDKVQMLVWQSISSGYDLAGLTQSLKQEYGVTKRRAALIASDQANKAHAAFEKARRTELGIKKAIWLHSHAGKQPRPSHLAANGKEFDVSKGMYLDGKWVQPGEEINCRCGSKAIIEGVI
ncbi:phage head morphogenesis protein [Acinetobacter stercoris]|uniref:Phage Mu protein F like protein n=1 Tax=Acinetobacter stercoris TaxID=2126983 RepID=A0A2U3MZQ0_9GAMM|nr:phage minor head protein [Acinetobacter stercoris]SPL70853.1 Phage Mu protein F like protein [Acinetobacter stercoris]